MYRYFFTSLADHTHPTSTQLITILSSSPQTFVLVFFQVQASDWTSRVCWQIGPNLISQSLGTTIPLAQNRHSLCGHGQAPICYHVMHRDGKNTHTFGNTGLAFSSHDVIRSPTKDRALPKLLNCIWILLECVIKFHWDRQEVYYTHTHTLYNKHIKMCQWS